MEVAEWLSSAEHGRYVVDVLDDVRIPTAESGVSLGADVWLPRDAGRVPALVLVTPYGKDGSSDLVYGGSLRWFAERGYACVLVDLGGTGSSDGIQRPPFDPVEADDATTAVDWAAGQTWCDGSVGMWGLSWVGRLALAGAVRRPSPLKAIMPIMTGTRFSGPDSERLDFYLTNLMGAALLSGQLLPPLADRASRRGYRRWQERLHEAEPTLMDWARHGPGDPVWRDRDRALDVESIAVPTLCVGGWLDLLSLEGVIGIYEQISAPRKLLVGPWQHNLPNAQTGGIDFLALALRWWDYWLRGVDNGVMEEPPITLYVEGDPPSWRGFESWPPGKGELVLATGADLALSEPARSGLTPANAIAVYQPDPTIGALSGLSGVPVPAGAEPPDQHDDDTRAVSATSMPLLEELVLAGRPEVTVRLVDDEPTVASAAERIVAKLAEVDPEGRSRFVSYGSVRPDKSNHTYQIILRPITHRIRAGHRLRITISDGDFPRLTPLPNPNPFRIAGIGLFVPTVSDGDGAPVDIPIEQSVSVAAAGLFVPRYHINRDLVHDGVEVIVGFNSGGVYTRNGHLFEMDCEAHAVVRRTAPNAARMGTTFITAVQTSGGERVRSAATVRLSQAALWARGEVTIDDVTVFSRTWETPLNVSGQEVVP